MLINSVDNNKQQYSKKEINRAVKARQMHQLLGWPSTQHFKSYVKNNMLKNCDVTVDDINRAEKIYGVPSPILQGKMSKPEQKSKRVSVIPLPMDISEEHRNIILSIDILFINKFPFLITHGSPVNYLSESKLKNRTKQKISNQLRIIHNKYKGRGFNITLLFGDNEFDHDKIREEMSGIVFDICAANEHIPVVERAIRTVKDKTRCMCKSVPFGKYTNLMTTHVVRSAVNWINRFPSKGGLSETLSPAKIIDGLDDPDMKVKRLGFGTYALAYSGTTNNMSERSTPAIALSESNQSGG